LWARYKTGRYSSMFSMIKQLCTSASPHFVEFASISSSLFLSFRLCSLSRSISQHLPTCSFLLSCVHNHLVQSREIHQPSCNPLIFSSNLTEFTNPLAIHLSFRPISQNSPTLLQSTYLFVQSHRIHQPSPNPLIFSSNPTEFTNPLPM